jgi:twitching motility protein PilT
MENNSTDTNDFMDIPQLPDNKSEIFVLVKTALDRGASDLILSVGSNPTLRIDGKLAPIFEKPKLTAGYIEKLLDLIIAPEQKKIFLQNRELDFSYIFKDEAFLRVNAFFQKGSMSCVIRIIQGNIKSFGELNLPESLKKFTEEMHGLVLVTGPTGSGKSTTIAAILEEINKNRTDHILTIEDPIEYVFKPKQCVVNQRELGRDTLNFKNALRAALREDFDVIFIGELRDMESIEAALDIAETGHLVLATIHSSSAASAPDRVVSAFPPYYQTEIRNQLSNVLIGIVAQRLIPKIDGGRIPAMEIMMVNQAAKNIIKSGKTDQLKTIIETGANEGMISFEQSLSGLIESGKISPESVRKLR